MFIDQDHLGEDCPVSRDGESRRRVRSGGAGKSSRRAIWILLAALLCLAHTESYALQGNINSHDPSGLVKDGDRYYQFTTGDGIYSAYSTDLISWTSAPDRVFPIGTWPAWINTVVPGFRGNFWAPDVIQINGRWYVYYACSTFGSSRSAIGVATSASLAGPWEDLGMVVSSTSRGDVNAIDPGLFQDHSGRVYLTYGSFSGGIAVTEIDPLTAKLKSDAQIVRVAGGGGADYEAPYLTREGPYYYLFVNRGFCCRGSNSSYYVQVGRSLTPFGPYEGWRTVLSSSGRYIGPGHVGIMHENGVHYVSMHYYDAEDGGAPKLDILTLKYAGGWPSLTRDWIPAGQYQIANQHSGLVWDAWGCTGALGQMIAQGSWANLICQKWYLAPQGDGIYR
ncbi:MAG TPA: family 43 glycosylhydrolase, partial [Blastocatellia bacterium]|nr:family 43 glycosylhydrolase [Blastocatellia bacterium]